MDGIVPIRKIFSIIDSCVSLKQLKSCEKLIINYTKIIKNKGVINHYSVLQILKIKIEERRSELKISNSFRGMIRRNKVKELIKFKKNSNKIF